MVHNNCRYYVSKDCRLESCDEKLTTSITPLNQCFTVRGLPEHGDEEVKHEDLCEEDVAAKECRHHRVRFRASVQIRLTLGDVIIIAA